MASHYRYCLGDNYFYMPDIEAELTKTSQLCWARVYAPVEGFFERRYKERDFEVIEAEIGSSYLKRVKLGCPQGDGRGVMFAEALMTVLPENPEASPDRSHSNFTHLCGDLFAGQGVSVDICSESGDRGLAFFALSGDGFDPILFALRAGSDMVEGADGQDPMLLHQIYGAAKAWDPASGVAISGAAYCPRAKEFSALESSDVAVSNCDALLDWTRRYRWNIDEREGVVGA